MLDRLVLIFLSKMWRVSDLIQGGESSSRAMR